MQVFANLLDRLEMEQDDAVRVRHLVAYLQTTPDPDRGWAVALLTDRCNVPRLKAYLEILGAFYETDDFLAFSNAPSQLRRNERTFKIAATPEVRATIEASEYLRFLFLEGGTDEL